MISLLFFCSCSIDCNDVRRQFARDVLIDSLSIDIGGRVTGINLCSDDIANRCHLVFELRQNLRHFIYSLTSNIIVDSIRNVPYIKDRRNAFYFNEACELWCLNSKKNRIEVYNDKKLLRTLSFEDTDSIPEKKYSLYLPFRVKENEMLIYSIPNIYIGQKEAREIYFHSSLIKLYMISGDKLYLKRNLGKFPEHHVQKFTKDLYPIAVAIGDSLLVYLYRSKKDIYVENVYSGAKIKYELMCAAELNISEYDIDSISNFSYSSKYTIENDENLRLLYDKVNCVYYLFRLHGVGRYDSSGRLNLYEDKPAVLYVIDKTFSVLKIIRFDSKHSYYFLNAFCFDGLLYIPKIQDEFSHYKIDIYDCFK